MKRSDYPLVVGDIPLNTLIKELRSDAQVMLRAMRRTHKLSLRAVSIEVTPSKEFHAIFAEYSRTVGLKVERTLQTLLFENGVLCLCSVPMNDTAIVSKSNEALRTMAKATYATYEATKNTPNNK